MKKQSIPFIAASLTAAYLFTALSVVSAAPSFVFDAKGFNQLGTGPLTTALEASNLQLSGFGGATIANGAVYSFPIIGGAVDAETIKLEAVSVGGVKITNVTDVLALNSPIVNTTLAQPIMTFLVTINGNLQGRFAIFDLKVPSYPKPQNLFPGESVHALSIGVTLSQIGANLVNSTFSTGLAAGQTVGTLRVRSVLGQKLPE